MEYLNKYLNQYHQIAKDVKFDKIDKTAFLQRIEESIIFKKYVDRFSALFDNISSQVG